jgi:hypothetical protein
MIQTNGWDERTTWIYQGGKDHFFDHDGLLILCYIIYFIKNNVKTKVSKRLRVKGVNRPPQFKWPPNLHFYLIRSTAPNPDF